MLKIMEENSFITVGENRHKYGIGEGKEEPVC